jgi:pyrroline-5-carboxylate reductase
MHKICFIGAGSMGSAIAKGIISSKQYSANEICLYARSKEKLTSLQEQYGFAYDLSLESAIQNLDPNGIIVFAVKPQSIQEVLEHFPSIPKTITIVSILAGTRIQSFEERFPENPIIRVMPNTPSQISKGASAIAANNKANQEQVQRIKEIFESIGLAIILDESKLDIVTALSGSGPAYVFLIIEALTEAATRLGLDEASAKALSIQTVYGAVSLVKESKEEASTLREKVTSPNGTTQAGLTSLNDSNLKEIFYKALKAARDRSIELA